ncbi:hypothetical protein B0T10DRAFT_481141 [Thelonectria olida]|uniref:Fungal N-terminal domain-containing protein n=1 Tax=Thelonectria olida TaxID=1576542 RepID=A0A9P8W850_9HYPO|nr:hypothetical protein B0T10DRAFT_481141 [Thelonectria olida]
MCIKPNQYLVLRPALYALVISTPFNPFQTRPNLPMSLQSPLSVGDAILLAKIAYNVAQAFSSGAKSAPAEFAEVQSLVRSVKHSLDLLARTLPQDPEGSSPATVSQETHTALSDIRDNCSAVLADLEDFVKKYMILDKAAPGKSVRGWGDQIKRGWKKVAWTTEEEGIKKMKERLTNHLHALNSFILTMKIDQETGIRGNVEMIHYKIDDIYGWFNENVKKEQSSASPGRQPSHAQNQSAEPSRLEFALYEQTSTSSAQQKTLICPHVAFANPDPPSDGNVNQHFTSRIFRCLCSSLNTRNRTITARDHSSQLAHTILPISLFVQAIHPSPRNRLSWQIYLYSPLSNSPVSLLVEQVPPSFLAEFEARVNQVRVFQAATHLANNLNTALVLDKDDSVSILNMKSDGSHFARSVSVRFITNGTSLLVKRLSSLQLLHHSSAQRDCFDAKFDNGPVPINFAPEPYLNIQIVSNNPTGLSEEQRYSIQLHHDTPVASSKGPRFVSLQKCLCTQAAGLPSQESESINCSEVEFEFLDASMAYEYLENLKAIKHRLHLYYLQRPRWGEIADQRHVGNIMIRHLVLNDAKLSIILDPSTGRRRGVISCGDLSASICVEFPPDFLEAMATGTASVRRNQAAWFVVIGKDFVDIEKQDCGIDLFSPTKQDVRRALGPSGEQ